MSSISSARRWRKCGRHVEALPARSAIIYSAIYSDGEGTYFSPAKGFELVAEKANRPIVVAAEPLVALGSIGGPVIVPGLIGADAAKLALRILHGEPASSIARNYVARGEADLQLAADAAMG